MGRYTGKSCRLILMLSITVVFFVAEIVVGYMGNSIALVSDSFNMLSDLLSMSVGLAAARMSRRAGTGRSTYGYARAEVVGALANAVFLAALCFSISMESLKRIAKPGAIDDPRLVLIVGSMGLAVNVFGLLIFLDWRCLCAWTRRDASGAREEDQSDKAEAGRLDQSAALTEQEKKSDGPPLNIRGVLLHVLNDALGSVVVVVASSLFYVLPLEDDTCNWQCYVDPCLTLVMVAITLSSAVPLVKETATILLQMSPVDLQLESVLEKVRKLAWVHSVHEAHVWELSKGRNVASLHVKVSADTQGPSLSQWHREVLEVFHYADVHSLTVQFEPSEGEQDSGDCSAPCLSPVCLKMSCCPHLHTAWSPADHRLEKESQRDSGKSTKL